MRWQRKIRLIIFAFRCITVNITTCCHDTHFLRCRCRHNCVQNPFHDDILWRKTLIYIFHCRCSVNESLSLERMGDVVWNRILPLQGVTHCVSTVNSAVKSTKYESIKFSLNRWELSLNSANSGNLINHWSMNWAQYISSLLPVCC